MSTGIIRSIVTLSLYIVCCVFLFTILLVNDIGRNTDIVHPCVKLSYCNICCFVTSPSCNFALMIVALWYSLFQLSSADVPDTHTCSSALGRASHRYRSATVPAGHQVYLATALSSRKLNSSTMPASHQPGSANVPAHKAKVESTK